MEGDVHCALEKPAHILSRKNMRDNAGQQGHLTTKRLMGLVSSDTGSVEQGAGTPFQGQVKSSPGFEPGHFAQVALRATGVLSRPIGLASTNIIHNALQGEIFFFTLIGRRTIHRLLYLIIEGLNVGAQYTCQILYSHMLIT